MLATNVQAQTNNSITRNDLNGAVTQKFIELEGQVSSPRLQAEASGLLFNGSSYFTGETYQNLNSPNSTPEVDLAQAIQKTLLSLKERNINPLKYNTASELYAAYPRSDINIPNQTALTTVYNASKDPEIKLAISGAYRTYPTEKLSLFIIGISGLQPKDLSSAKNLDPIFNAVDAYSK
ncbi:MAG: hypothetical protein P4L16_02620 [Chlamydiales bacterium]|nr:hypothetical protein [Chlamydiales bacterium]